VGLNISYKRGLIRQDDFSGKKPGEVIQFLEDEFLPRKKEYCKGEHEVYRKKEGGNREEQRHYWDLRFGDIEFKIGEEEILSSPRKKVCIDYIIQVEQIIH